MDRTLRHATALTDHREHERLDQSLLESVLELAAPPLQRGARAAKGDGGSPANAVARSMQVRLWRLQGTHEGAPLVLSARTDGSGQLAHQTAPLTAPLTAHPSASQPLSSEPCPATEQHLREALRRLEPLTAAQRHANGHLAYRTLLPVTRRDTALGVLEVESAAPLSPSRLPILMGMCSLYANHLSLLHDSQVDTLTQLLNRKTFDDSIQRLLGSAAHQAAQCGAPTWVAVIDIDHFKRINDGYGHLFGDEVLLLVAGMLRRAFRHQDKVFRFGGEEFVVLLQGLDAAGASAALERLRQTIEAHRFPQVGRVTISIGATAIQAGDAACDALGRADDALYHAKSQGRNQVCVFEQLQAQGAIATSATVHGEVDLF